MECSHYLGGFLMYTCLRRYTEQSRSMSMLMALSFSWIPSHSIYVQVIGSGYIESITLLYNSTRNMWLAAHDRLLQLLRVNICKTSAPYRSWPTLSSHGTNIISWSLYNPNHNRYHMFSSFAFRFCISSTACLVLSCNIMSYRTQLLLLACLFAWDESR